MSGNQFPAKCLLVLIACVLGACCAEAGAQTVASFSTNLSITGSSNLSKDTHSAVLQLFDGSVLHGAVARIDAGKTVQWQHPASTGPLQFTITNIARIRFDQPVGALRSERANCRFQFFNGDEITGNLSWMDESKTG